MDIEKMPKDLFERERSSIDLMSNFDGVVDKDVEKTLKENSLLTAEYPGWNFWGLCWHSENMFHCLIKTYSITREIIDAETPEELMEKVCARYGNQ